MVSRQLTGIEVAPPFHGDLTSEAGCRTNAFLPLDVDLDIFYPRGNRDSRRPRVRIENRMRLGCAGSASMRSMNACASGAVPRRVTSWKR